MSSIAEIKTLLQNKIVAIYENAEAMQFKSAVGSVVSVGDVVAKVYGLITVVKIVVLSNGMVRTLWKIYLEVNYRNKMIGVRTLWQSFKL